MITRVAQWIEPSADKAGVSCGSIPHRESLNYMKEIMHVEITEEFEDGSARMVVDATREEIQGLVQAGLISLIKEYLDKNPLPPTKE